MNRKVETITWDDEHNFDRMVNEFLAEDYVIAPVITYNSNHVPYDGGIKAVFIAHITYIDGSEFDVVETEVPLQ